MKILLTGGGTMGPVTPLLAIVEAWRKRGSEIEFVWVGTPQGPEREVVEHYGIRFFSLPAARFPRHVSIEWILLPFKMILAFLQARRIIRSERPDLIASAGGYTAVPVVKAGWMKGIPIWIHQSDVQPILTNKITSKFASWISVAFKESLSGFPKSKTTLVGNPIRKSTFDGSKAKAIEMFGLDPHKPTILVYGGGTGAKWINDAMEEIGRDLSKKANVIHLTGRGKMHDTLKNVDRYHAFEFLDEGMKHALAVADVVVCRAGLAAITELVALKKAAILIPLPNSPQEKNVAVLGNAVVTVHQRQGVEKLEHEIEKLVEQEDYRKQFQERIQSVLKTDVADEIIDKLEILIQT